jgi:hypothetical protein
LPSFLLFSLFSAAADAGGNAAEIGGAATAAIGRIAASAFVTKNKKAFQKKKKHLKKQMSGQPAVVSFVAEQMLFQ